MYVGRCVIRCVCVCRVTLKGAKAEVREKKIIIMMMMIMMMYSLPLLAITKYSTTVNYFLSNVTIGLWQN